MTTRRTTYQLSAIAIAGLVLAAPALTKQTAVSNARGLPINWSAPVVVHDQPVFPGVRRDARKLRPGGTGSQFPRLVRLTDGSWLIAYMNYANNGYGADPRGGTELRFKRSGDDGRTWTKVGTLAEPGRDLDNGQIVEASDGTLLLAYRSVRWGESYRILARTSRDGGGTWSAATSIDATEGTPGSLSHPDRGLYEPYMMLFDGGEIAVMYASEKYAKASPAYSQVISMKTSKDGGRSWGPETFPVRDLNNSAARPGMPVWTRTRDGSYALVYEMCGSDDCNAWIKTSPDGRTWDASLGQRIPHQLGAPYILSLTDGTMLVTSNTHRLSASRDGGRTWSLSSPSPWGSLKSDLNLWPALIQTKPDEIAFFTSAGRRKSAAKEGNSIQVKFGVLSPREGY